MGKIIKFPTGEILNETKENNNNKLIEDEKMKYIINTSNQMQKTYTEGNKLINDLLLGLSNKYITETEMEASFENVMIEIFKLYISNTDYDINKFVKKFENF